MYQNDKNSRHIVYKSDNFLIKWVGRLFFHRIDRILKSLNARDKLGADIGCGESHLLNILQRNGRVGAVVAYDLNMTNLDNAKQCYPGFTYVQGDAQSIAFLTATFNYVIALEILEHVENPRAVLGEIRRITKPDAAILISVPNEPFFHLGNMLRGKYLKRYGRTPNHLSFWNAWQFKALLKEFYVIDQVFLLSVFPWQLYVCRPKADNAPTGKWAPGNGKGMRHDQST